jgi:hypothetical protein
MFLFSPFFYFFFPPGHFCPITLANSCRAAADVLYEVLTIMVKKGPLSIQNPAHEQL